MHYAGTGSVYANITKKGKTSLAGLIDHGVKSLNRLYTGNFEDGNRQKFIDLLVGNHAIEHVEAS